MRKAMLTTFDNPFDPYENFEDWFMFDINKQYNSCGLLARFANYTEEMTEEEKDLETERAIDAIIESDFLHIYKKIYKDDSTIPLTSY